MERQENLHVTGVEKGKKGIVVNSSPWEGAVKEEMFLYSGKPLT